MSWDIIFSNSFDNFGFFKNEHEFISSKDENTDIFNEIKKKQEENAKKLVKELKTNENKFKEVDEKFMKLDEFSDDLRSINLTLENLRNNNKSLSEEKNLLLSKILI